MSIDIKHFGPAGSLSYPLMSHQEAITTGTTDQKAFDSTTNEEQWQSLWDRLIDWNHSPSRIDEDELEFPSRHAIGTASSILPELKQLRSASTPILAPDGEGGISIEYRFSDGITELIEIDRSGAVEMLKLVNSKLVMRAKIAISTKS